MQRVIGAEAISQKDDKERRTPCRAWHKPSLNEAEEASPPLCWQVPKRGQYLESLKEKNTACSEIRKLNIIM
jgi:hypothetical protein